MVSIHLPSDEMGRGRAQDQFVWVRICLAAIPNLGPFSFSGLIPLVMVRRIVACSMVVLRMLMPCIFSIFMRCSTPNPPCSAVAKDIPHKAHPCQGVAPEQVCDLVMLWLLGTDGRRCIDQYRNGSA